MHGYNVKKLRLPIADGQISGGYVPRDKPFYLHLKSEVQSRKNGFVFFKIGKNVKCTRTLQDSPWLFGGKLIT